MAIVDWGDVDAAVVNISKNPPFRGVLLLQKYHNEAV